MNFFFCHPERSEGSAFQSPNSPNDSMTRSLKSPVILRPAFGRSIYAFAGSKSNAAHPERARGRTAAARKSKDPTSVRTTSAVRLFLKSLCLLLLLAAMAAAQTVSGTVTNGTTGKPAAGIAVVLINLGQGGME